MECNDSERILASRKWKMLKRLKCFFRSMLDLLLCFIALHLQFSPLRSKVTRNLVPVQPQEHFSLISSSAVKYANIRRILIEYMHKHMLWLNIYIYFANKTMNSLPFSALYYRLQHTTWKLPHPTHPWNNMADNLRKSSSGSKSWLDFRTLE